MGIELSSFRTAVAGDGQWLSVQSGDMSKVVGSAEKQAIDVSDLSVAQKTDDLNKAANNIYMRGQLLEGIRSSLSGMDIRKDEHGNMKVRCQLASTRFNGVDLAPEDQRTGGAAFNFSLVTSTDDLVEEFTIRPDGKGTMDSIHFVQSDRPRNVVTVVDDPNRKVNREDIYGKEE